MADAPDLGSGKNNSCKGSSPFTHITYCEVEQPGSSLGS